MRHRVEGRVLGMVGRVTGNVQMEVAGVGRRVGVRLATRGLQGRMELD